MGIRRKIALAALALGFIAACNTPSVPIPPPVLSAISFQQPMDVPAGEVVVQGNPEPQHSNARFYVINRATGDGVITTAGADGSFTTTPFAGNVNDVIQLFYDTPAGEHSTEVCVTLVINTPLVSTECP